MVDKKEDNKVGGSNISNTEWGMVISLLFVIDGIQFALNWIGIPFIATLGTIANRFISFVTGLAWLTYLNLRGVSLMGLKLTSSILTFLFEEIPSIDALPLWGINGLYVMGLVKAEKEIKKAMRVGVAVAAVALAPETGGASLAAGGAVEGGIAATEASAAGEGTTAVAKSATESAEALAEEEEVESEVESQKATGGDNEDREQNEETLQQKKKREGEENAREMKKKEDEEAKNKDRKRKKSGWGGGGSFFGGSRDGRDGGNGPDPLNLRGGTADKERIKKSKELAAMQNVIDLTMSYGERKKKREEDE
ncbi:MAG: hypothetical protein UW34_C0001G0035 [Parcubacteria group bacterium GW2011_GWA2_44_15]|nr:MAG: hypothetical protein UW34_C0001G0035 [Parcubacteria group bacterium GW2011_GWA2_44_15]